MTYDGFLKSVTTKQAQTMRRGAGDVWQPIAIPPAKRAAPSSLRSAYYFFPTANGTLREAGLPAL